MDLDQYFQREPISERGISVVVPILGGAERLQSVVKGVCETLHRMERPYEIILVDDGSTEATGRVAEQLASNNNRVRVIRHKTREGCGAALRSGFGAAKYPLVLQMDGDEPFVIEDIERLLGVIDQVDVVCGRRRFTGKPARRIRRLLYYLCLRVLFAVPVRDPDCGLKLYRRNALRRIPIQSAGRFAYAEILAKATFLNMLIGEVELSNDARRSSAQKHRSEPFGQLLRDAVRVFWRPQFVPNRSGAAPKNSTTRAA